MLLFVVCSSWLLFVDVCYLLSVVRCRLFGVEWCVLLTWFVVPCCTCFFLVVVWRVSLVVAVCVLMCFVRCLLFVVGCRCCFGVRCYCRFVVVDWC